MTNYDSIRPYNDSETSEAMNRLAMAPELAPISEFIFGKGMEVALREKLKSLNDIYGFQSEIMAKAVRAILKKTAGSLNVKGVENIQDNRKHILISNHRDIILDPAIIQLILFDTGFATTEIAVGDNLIANSLIEDVFRSNRMIKVARGGTPREKYFFSQLLSSYMREAVTTGRCSVWIAQRNGRTKDGIDRTSQGLMKMMEISGSGDFVADFSELSLLPISVSYRFEPCDFLKARELYITRRKKYVKKPGEDTHSIITGITQQKGDISFCFSKAITADELEQCALLGKNERFQALANLIDSRIRGNFELWDTNYIAADMIAETDVHSSHYTADEKESFRNYMETGLAAIVAEDPYIDITELRCIFLDIYANPVRLHCGEIL